MSRVLKTMTLMLVLVGHLCTGPSTATAAGAKKPGSGTVLGVRFRGGARYDDVRMCVASAPGVKGGPAMDIALLVEIPLTSRMALDLNLPVMRPLLFGVAFKTLQFEPEVSLIFRVGGTSSPRLLVGPSLGLSFHYGPDYRSGPSGSERGDSFFAFGPRIGGYIGLDFGHPGKKFNFRLGLQPYVTPLWSVDDPQGRKGLVAGAVLDAQLRFGLGG